MKNGARDACYNFILVTYAIKEIQRANREDNLDIVPITVKGLLEHEKVAV